MTAAILSACEAAATLAVAALMEIGLSFAAAAGAFA